jgi:MYXO-CTERM domain-containing protein
MKKTALCRVRAPRVRGMLTSLALCLGVLAPTVASAAPYFTDATSSNFPAPACVVENNPDDEGDEAGKRLGCYTNFLVVSDVDGDDDLDILMANGGGYYEPDVAEESSLYLNDGDGAFSNGTKAVLGGVTSRLRQVAIADIDGDGDKDLYLPGGYGVDTDHLFIQTAKGVFADEADLRLPPFTWSNAGAAHFGDLDGDGDLDLVVSDWGTPLESPGDTLVYLNDGKGVFTSLDDDYVPPPIKAVIGSTPIDIDLADVDGDFDLDILVNHRNGQSRVFLNDGRANFSDKTVGNYPQKKGPYSYNVEACDYDEDGDLDLLVDNAGGTLGNTYRNISQVLQNDGKGRFTDVTATTIEDEPFSDDNAVKCADIDGDGHYDLLVASLTHPAEKVLLNDGKGKFTYVDGGFPAVTDPSLGIDVADINEDGLLDVVTGQGEWDSPNSRIDRIYLGGGASVADTTAPKFRAIEKPEPIAGEPTVVRFAVLDSHTSETGEHVKDVALSYKVDGGAEETVPATFIGGDLFRAIIPAQAAGAEISFTVKATDRQGTEASSEATVIKLAAAPVGEGGGAGADAGGVGGTEPSTGGSPDSAGAPSTGGSGASAPIGGEGGGAEEPAPSKGDDDGCGCSVPGASPTSPGAFAALLLAAGFMARRRRGV